MIREHVICRDGTTISVQAGNTYYCTPKDDTGPYTKVEVQTQIERGIHPPEWDTYDSGGLHAYVPALVLIRFIENCGGLQRGQLPPLLITEHQWQQVAQDHIRHQVGQLIDTYGFEMVTRIAVDERDSRERCSDE